MMLERVGEKNGVGWAVVYLIAILIYFPTISRPIRDAESKYVEIPREMLVLHDWVTPHLDFVNYYTKPPLTFWVTALGYRIFGVYPWVARLTNILWAFLASFLLGIFASRISGRQTGPIASAAFLLTSEVFAYSLDAGIEFALISGIIGALMAFWNYFLEGRKRDLRLFYFWVGFCYLVKGILGLGLPLAIAGVFLLISRNTNRLVDFLDPFGLFLLSLCVLPWTIAMSVKHPDFLRYFVVNEHLAFLVGKRDSNVALFPTSRFLALMIGEFFPWTLYLPIIVKGLMANWKTGGVTRKFAAFLVTWISVPLILFSASRSKVDFYGMHVYPPLILLLASEAGNLVRYKIRLSLWAYPWLIVSFLAAISLTVFYFEEHSQVITNLAIPSTSVAKVFLKGAIILGFLVFLCFRTRAIAKGFVMIAIFMIFMFFCIEQMYIAAFDNESMKFAADIYNRTAKKGELLFSDELPEFAHIAILAFYTKRPAYLLRDPEGSKLYFTLKDRMSRCYDEEQFVRLVKIHKRVYLVGKTRKTVERLRRLNLHFKVLGKSGKRSLFLVYFLEDDKTKKQERAD